jgi:hypothetical protein
MANEEICFGVYSEVENIIVYDCKQVGSKLYAQAAGLDIYLISEDNTRHPDCLNAMMLNACILRHIPTISLHLVTRVSRVRRIQTDTKEMF